MTAEPQPLGGAPVARPRGNPAHAAALAADAAGLCVLPPRGDGSKAPDAASWTEYQRRRSTAAEIEAWYANGRTGLGLVCGAVSGGLEMLEIEGRGVAEGVHSDFRELCQAAGLGELLTRIMAGYSELTPSGGYHLLYRVPTPRGNALLAARPATAAELEAKPGDKKRVLIETRGERGYVVIAPSSGKVHPDGGAWRLEAGGFESIATISDTERDDLWGVARVLDRMPAPAERPRQATGTQSGDRPGDAYNRLPDIQHRTVDLLVRHGWTWVCRKGETDYLRRPGKTTSVSATVGYVGPGVLRNFSTAVAEFEDRSYNPFAVLAILEHDGDYSAAASALVSPGVVLGPSAPIHAEDLEEDPPLPTWRTLADVADDPPGALLLGILEPDGPNLLNAAGGTGKGTSGAWMIRELIESGRRPMIYDAENRPKEWARRTSGLGVDRSRVIYLQPADLPRAMLGRPLWDAAPHLGAVAHASGADLLFIDSILAAVGVGEERLRSDAQAPYLYVAALDALAIPSVSFSHPPKGQPDGDPFGSVAWINAMRLTWQGTAAEGTGHRVRWRPRKRNERGHIAGVLLTFSYSADGRLADAVREDDDESTREWILAGLTFGARTPWRSSPKSCSTRRPSRQAASRRAAPKSDWAARCVAWPPKASSKRRVRRGGPTCGRCASGVADERSKPCPG